jgi:hypothetical protein
MRASATLVAVAFAASTAMAQSASSSADDSARPPGAKPVKKPIDLEIEAPATDFIVDVSKVLDDIHDDYRKFKKELLSDYDVHYSMQVSIFRQWGSPKGGPGTAELVYFPQITWNPFANAAIGSGSFNVAIQQNQFWTKANAAPNKHGSA